MMDANRMDRTISNGLEEDRFIRVEVHVARSGSEDGDLGSRG